MAQAKTAKAQTKAVQAKTETVEVETNTVNHDNIFQKACLVQLQTSCWTGTRNLNQRVLKEIANSEWLRGKKLLINPEYLGPIKTSLHMARNYLNQQALPFPLNGLSLVPKESLVDVDRMLERFKHEYWKKVEAFIAEYEPAREEAKEILGELFNDADYPINIRNKFRFDWRFLILDVPDKASILPPELYDRERRKFVTLMEETQELAMIALRTEFGDLVTYLVDRLSGNDDGKPKTFRSSMIAKMTDFLDSFQSRNFFDDDRLATLVEQARTIVAGVSPYALRYNEDLRNGIAKDMTRLKKEVDKAIEELPRRRIRMANAA